MNDTTTKKQDICLTYGTDNKTIERIVSWSLASIPENSITKNTLVLLPNIESGAYKTRAAKCDYAATNIYNSYSRCNPANLRLFDSTITESAIFYDDQTCILSTYLPNSTGHSAPSTVIPSTDIRYACKLASFQTLWNNSKPSSMS